MQGQPAGLKASSPYSPTKVLARACGGRGRPRRWAPTASPLELRATCPQSEDTGCRSWFAELSAWWGANSDTNFQSTHIQCDPPPPPRLVTWAACLGLP